MAFTMQNIERKFTTTKDNVVECKRMLKSYKILTENVRQSVWEYAKYRLCKRKHSTFTSTKLKSMLDELLSHVINKDINSIIYQDVLNNENELIYEIAKAIYYGAVHHLYYIQTDDSIIFSKKTNQTAPRKLDHNERLKLEELENYFKEMMI